MIPTQAVFYLFIDELYLEKSTDSPWQWRFSTNAVSLQFRPVDIPASLPKPSLPILEGSIDGDRDLDHKEDASLSGRGNLEFKKWQS